MPVDQLPQQALRDVVDVPSTVVDAKSPTVTPI